jgi:hypothetical protein
MPRIRTPDPYSQERMGAPACRGLPGTRTCFLLAADGAGGSLELYSASNSS